MNNNRNRIQITQADLTNSKNKVLRYLKDKNIELTTPQKSENSFLSLEEDTKKYIQSNKSVKKEYSFIPTEDDYKRNKKEENDINMSLIDEIITNNDKIEEGVSDIKLKILKEREDRANLKKLKKFRNLTEMKNNENLDINKQL